MKRKLIRAALLCLIAALLLTPALHADTIGGATVNGDQVRLRASASTATAANIITQMQRGEFLLVEEVLDGWYKVAVNGVEGYVSAEFADFSEDLDGTYGYDGVVTAGTDVILRAGATTKSAVVKVLPELGTGLTVFGVSGKWLRVRDAAGTEGFIRSDLVRYSGDSALGMVTAYSVGEQVVQTASLYKGYSYRWGGMSPSTGFDCSGFVNYVYDQYGCDLHRVAQDIYNSDGTFVSKDELALGDVLCFGYGPNSITHVGIYIGSGQMIHASTSTTGVIISDVDSKYYTQMYVGAKRIV